MTQKKKEQPSEKPKLHPRNKNRERYDFNRLIASSSELAVFPDGITIFNLSADRLGMTRFWVEVEFLTY